MAALSAAAAVGRDGRRERRQLARGPCDPGSAPPRWRRRPRTGWTAAIASATLSGFSPPDRITGREGRWDAVRARELPGERLAGAARDARHVAVEQVVVGVERGQRLDVGAAAHARRLDHAGSRCAAPPRRRTRAPRRRAAGASSARPRRRSRATWSSVGVDEHADDLGPALDRARRSRPRRVELAAPRRAAARRSSRSPRRRRSTASSASSSRVMPQNLILRCSQQHIVGTAQRAGRARGRRPRCRASASAPRRSAPRRRPAAVELVELRRGV